ncbi:hypothetical protein BX666DRAFT_2002902 [Dichotomocladium elegans]|nr:hypothetical protein BX666DRAFT_2002902 [Dichotomocladium elegans]
MDFCLSTTQMRVTRSMHSHARRCKLHTSANNAHILLPFALLTSANGQSRSRWNWTPLRIATV